MSENKVERSFSNGLLQLGKLWDRWEAQHSIGLDNLMELANIARKRLYTQTTEHQDSMAEQWQQFTKRTQRFEDIYLEISAQIQQLHILHQQTCSSQLTCSDCPLFSHFHPSHLCE
jgi:hypothetical protein